MAAYVTDTHTLLRYCGIGRGKLPSRAARVFRRCEEGKDRVIVPAVVIWETALLVEDGVITLRPSFSEWWDTVASMPHYGIHPVDLPVVKAAFGLTALPDPSDRLIVATAISLGLPLLSGDARIADSGLVRIVW
jgi:PIN domain nuclease of toxin-antitoxin system